jgi:hypothetical protein
VRCTSKDPAGRPAGFTAISEELERLLGRLSGEPEPAVEQRPAVLVEAPAVAAPSLPQAHICKAPAT